MTNKLVFKQILLLGLSYVTLGAHCTVGRVPNIVDNRLASDTYYMLSDPTVCSGRLNSIRICYRGVLSDDSMTVSISTWRRIIATTVAKVTEQKVTFSTQELLSGVYCNVFSFSIAVITGDYVAFKFNTTSNGAVAPAILTYSQEPENYWIVPAGEVNRFDKNDGIIVGGSPGISVLIESDLESDLYIGLETVKPLMNTNLIGASSSPPGNSSSTQEANIEGSVCGSVQSCVPLVLAVVIGGTMLCFMLAAVTVVAIGCLIRKSKRSSTDENTQPNRFSYYNVQRVASMQCTETVESPSAYAEIEENVLQSTLRSIGSESYLTGILEKKEGEGEEDNSYALLEEDECLYQSPPCGEEEIYSTLKDMDLLKIDYNMFQLCDYLGTGHFATVYKGQWESSAGPKDVAIKVLKSEKNNEMKIKFLKEAAIMGQFLHPNVVKLYGLALNNSEIMMVLEYMHKSDLSNYLQKTRKQSPDLRSLEEMPVLLKEFAYQVASGMSYLSKKAFIHRDIAARNILVNQHNVCKIGDFGMARDLENSSLYIASGGEIPIKWTATEAIIYQAYSSASDVWSYGVLLYEMWSLGKRPFRTLSNTEVLEYLATGKRLPPPPGCPRKIYQFMILSWHPEAAARPRFQDAVNLFAQPNEELLQRTVCDGPTLKCDVIGEELIHGYSLYLDLQETYIKIT